MPVVHRHLTYDQMRDRLAASVPLEFAAMLAGLERAIAQGAEDRTAETVQHLAGRPPHSLRAVAERKLAGDGTRLRSAQDAGPARWARTAAYRSAAPRPHRAAQPPYR
ncbi:hypothetical protein [Streptomyces sp. NPDC101165]|uniref:hypothetical protein n=1 Tax=Streptomyces sp. NPDC101165 TaxID=3366119 RepID=UPI003827E630